MTQIRTAAVALLLVAASVSAAPAVAQEGTVDCSFPVSATDATGTEVTVGEEPQRVVVLGPSTAQTTWEIGAEGKVVGMPVNRFTAYLNGSESRTDVVDERGQPVAEAVVGTEPDLVLAPNIIGEEAIAGLRDAGLTVYKFRAADSLSDVANKTRTTGRLVGAFGSATRVAANTEARIDAVRAAVADREKPTVFYPLGGGFTAGPRTFVGDVLSTAGGNNVATRANISTYAAISQEVLAATTVDWIVTTGDSPLPSNTAINNSRAVARDQVVRVNANYFNQPGPRVVGPLGEIASAFHPEAMDGVDLASVTGDPSVRCEAAATPNTTTPGEEMTTMTTAINSSDTPATETTVTTETMMDPTTERGDADGGTTTASGDAPGFTLVGAVLALVAAALLAARRR
jgi:iron complex transport system substrate-binding protein